jgi:hypothetical protein
LHFKDGTQRCHGSTRRSVTEIRDQLRLSRLGPHRHGRLQRDEVDCGGCVRDSLARCRRSSKSNRQILARPQSNSLVADQSSACHAGDRTTPRARAREAPCGLNPVHGRFLRLDNFWCKTAQKLVRQLQISLPSSRPDIKIRALKKLGSGAGPEKRLTKKIRS